MIGTPYRTKVQYKDEPEWDGTPGQNVVIYAEQGLGDEISFASMIPDAVGRTRDAPSAFMTSRVSTPETTQPNVAVELFACVSLHVRPLPVSRIEPSDENMSAAEPSACDSESIWSVPPG